MLQNLLDITAGRTSTTVILGNQPFTDVSPRCLSATTSAGHRSISAISYPSRRSSFAGLMQYSETVALHTGPKLELGHKSIFL